MKLKRLLSLLVLIALCTLTVYAEGVGVSISAEEPVYTASGVTVRVETVFHDMSLYHEEVFLSYHIFDTEGNLLLYENQRVPLTPDETGKAVNEILADFVSAPELAGAEQAEIYFDLVDQKNVFWFADNANVEFQTTSILFDRANLLPEEETPSPAPVPSEEPTPSDGLIQPEEPEERCHPHWLSLCLCVLAWGVLVVGFWRVNRKPKK